MLLGLPAPSAAQQFVVKGSAGVGLMWEDNPFHLPPGQVRGSDLRVTPAARLELERPGPRLGLSIKAAAAYDRYRRARELDALQLRVDAQADARLGARCRLEPALAYETRRSDPADVANEANRLRTWTASAALACPRIAGLHPGLSVQLVDQANSEAFRAGLDSRTTQFLAELRYSRPSLGTAGAFLGYGVIDRPEGLLPSIDVWRSGVRFDRAVAPRLQGGVSVAYIRLSPRRSGAPPYAGAEWRANVRWRPAPEHSVTADLSRALRPEGSVAASYAVSTQAGLEASFRVGGRSRLIARASQERRAFKGVLPFGLEQPRDRDRTTRAALQLEYGVTPTLLLDAQVTHARRAAVPDIYEYRSTGAGLRLRYTF